MMFDHQDLRTTTTVRETRAWHTAKPGEDQSRFAGINVVVEWSGDVDTLAHKMRSVTAIGGFRLSLILSRSTTLGRGGVLDGGPRRHWHCRFAIAEDAEECERDVPWLLSVIGEHMRWIHVEKFEPGTHALSGAVNPCDAAAQ
jgi:hypothetical protein